MATLFQNCSQPQLGNQTLNSKKTSLDVPTTELILSGNGEGYSGKLSGIYAKVDYANYCAANSSAELRIRDQIEIRNNTAFYTIRNCQLLKSPVAFSLSEIQTSSQNNRVLIMQNEIFQKGAWISTGLVPREGYVSIFCQGRDLNTSPNVHRVADLFVNDSLLASQFKESFLSSNQITFFSSSFILSGQFQITDVSTAGNQILSTQDLTYNVQSTISGTASTSIFQDAINFYDGKNSFSSIFSASYASNSPLSELRPEQMQYFPAGSSTVPEVISAPLCWKHKGIF